ncbi:MAG TPA: hypothetical protein VKT49_13945, partial [Bryobacteraceae bacterium]|nr:hypothetical protein [Bryobacteraceae bacterium]
MREWLRETHGAQFELLRHFLLRFFDSDLVTTPGQTSAALIAVVSVCLPWFQVLIGPLRHKYAVLSTLPVAGPYREALRADELWLITLMMSLIGLLTAFKWQALFPDLRDYRALGSLPLRARQIFLAKLLALLIVAAGALIAINAIPSAGFPALTGGRWAFPGPRVKAYTLASLAACAFFFFGLVALQGVLLNVLRPRAFGRISGCVQGLLVAIMLGLCVLSFSIQPQFTDTVLRPEWSHWLPPVWFLGLCQTQSGDPDPAMHALAHRAGFALLIAAAFALLTYLISYQRHRRLLMEGRSNPTKNRRADRWLAWVLPEPRQHAVIGFMLQTLGRSSHHRMILMGYGGLGLAVVLSGLLGMANLVAADRRVAAGFLYFHSIGMLFLLIGARHLFSLPTELKANWLFQLTESEGRAAWLEAVDRLVLFWAALLFVAPLSLELIWVGWRGLVEIALLGSAGILAYEWLFSSWNKLPFTCSRLPGKTPGWILALRFFGLLTLGPILQAILLAALYSRWTWLPVLAALVAAWTRARALRRESRSDL